MQPKSHHTKTLKAMTMALLVGLSSTAHAGAESFAPGTAIPEFGQVAKVESTLAIPAGTTFKAFDRAPLCLQAFALSKARLTPAE